MKKLRIACLFSGEGKKLNLKKMKLTLLFSFLVFSGAWANSYSQATRLSLNLKNATVQELIQEIEQKTDFYFLYQDGVFERGQRVTIDAKNEPLKSILEKFEEQTSVKTEITEHQIILKKKIPDAAEVAEQQRTINGIVTDQKGEPMPGVSVVVTGTTTGTVTNDDGEFSLRIPPDVEKLQFSFVGFKTQEVEIGTKSIFNVVLQEEAVGLDEVIVVGYGTQKKSDITGTVASLSQDRLEMVPNISIAQALQGSVPGLVIQNTSAGAEPSLQIMVRGRNSIGANNSPLVVVDGIPYGGKLSDINPNDVESIEILKDASAAAIYGSRGANGVILVTTKNGIKGSPTITYDGYYSIQQFSNLPEYMDGPQFADFKIERLAAGLTTDEQAVYDAGEWVNWSDLAIRKGLSQQHNLSVSGGFGNTSYFVSGAIMNVQGIADNDDYFRGTGRFNLDTKIADWLTIGTRTQLTFSDKSGVAPNMSDVFVMNPLSVPYNEDGTLTIIPSYDDPKRANPLQEILFENKDISRRIVANVFAIVDFTKFIPGLNFRFNYGLTDGVSQNNTYRGRDTYDGMTAQGRASLIKNYDFNTVFENILTYKNDFGKHSIFATTLYSIQNDLWTSERLDMENFPNDLLTWNAGGQAGLVSPSFDYVESRLVSQMLRFNYSYDSRYLLTLTGRRDGYSGFGKDSKWGIFPSLALGWNFGNEEFFPWKNLFNQLKIRASYGLNGNQAVGSYRSMGTLEENNYLSGNTTMPGFFPGTLGQPTLGWESSRTINLGLDFGILDSRISGDLNVYHTNTYDLLLNRAISPIHGITSILQNIGETQNRGIEFSLHTRNIVKKNFTWSTMGNISYLKNKILDLYGNGLDDVGNGWFIGEPIRVNFNYVFDGVWQLDEAAEAAGWGSQPGYIKIKDVNNDGKITPDDRQIIGQQDPKLVWGMTNTFSYGNFILSIFLHGANGVTKQNSLMSDSGVTSGVRLNTIVKNWWTPDNPSNEWYMNDVDADRMAGVTTNIYENASFLRVKDITLSYDLPLEIIQKIGSNRFRVYATGRNLLTLTKWRGLDPELNDQRSIPLQREFVLGLQIGL